MWFLILHAALSGSPFDFEVDRGLSMELKGGGSIPSESVERSYDSGLRVSYSFANRRDFYLSAELEGTLQVATDKEKFLELDPRSNDRYKTMGQINVVAVEIFNPTAFRLAVGTGLERRFEKYNSFIGYRTGLGYFFNKDIALFGDFGSRIVFREAKTDYPIDLGLSIQAIL